MPRRGHLGFVQRVEGTGQQNSNAARLPHRVGVSGVGVFDMIGAERTIPRSQLRAADVRQLLGVQLHRKAQRAGRIEHARHLARVKGDAFAEPVHRIDQPFGMGGVQGRDADLINIAVRVA